MQRAEQLACGRIVLATRSRQELDDGIRWRRRQRRPVPGRGRACPRRAHQAGSGGVGETPSRVRTALRADARRSSANRRGAGERRARPAREAHGDLGSEMQRRLSERAERFRDGLSEQLERARAELHAESARSLGEIRATSARISMPASPRGRAASRASSSTASAAG